MKNVQEDWKSKAMEFTNEYKSSIISVFFHDELGYLFIGHMGVLIPTAKPFIMENDQLLEGYRENPNNRESDSK